MTIELNHRLATVNATASDESLLLLWVETMEVRRAAVDLMARIEFELQKRMEARGAAAILDPLFDCKLETPAVLDAERLRPLAELIPPDEWAKGFTEAHQETINVPAKADLRVVKGWTKYGTQIAYLIERAKVPGLPKVKITPRRG